jgi:hypothetical protein
LRFSVHRGRNRGAERGCIAGSDAATMAGG